MKVQSINSTNQLLAKVDSPYQFAILDPANNYCNLDEMRAIYAATYGDDRSKGVTELVPFRPRRILDHEIMTELCLNAQMDDLENQDRGLVSLIDMVKSKISSNAIDAFVSSSDELRMQTISKVKNRQLVTNQDEKNELEDAIASISVHADYDHLSPGLKLSAEEVKVLIAANKITNSKIRTNAQKTAKAAISSLIEEGSINRILRREASDRVSIAVTGGIASGKGTSIQKLKYHYAQTGRSWKDTIKVRGDSYKYALNSMQVKQNSVSVSEEAVGEKTIISSQLCRDESSFISTRIINAVKQELEETGRAPDMFIDKVMLPHNIVDIATHNDGQLFITLVSLPVEKAMERAYSRGLSSGRFEATKAILETHQALPAYLHGLLEHAADRHVVVEIVDNDVEFGEQAKEAALFDCKQGAYRLYDTDSLQIFCRKTDIDLQNSDENIVYRSSSISVDQYLKQITEPLKFISEANCIEHELEKHSTAAVVNIAPEIGPSLGRSTKLKHDEEIGE